MSEVIPRAKEIVLMWWAMGFWFCLFSLTSLGTAIVLVSYTMRWADVDNQDRVIACVLIFVNWGQTMMALMNRVASRLQAGQLPIEAGDSQLIQQTRIASVTQTSIEQKP